MVRTNRKFPAARGDDEDGNWQFGEETPFGSDTARDPLDDLIADLTFQPDVELEKSVRTGLSSVEEFHSDDATARRLASKLAPVRKPRIKIRRPRIRRVSDGRSLAPEEQFDRADRHIPVHAEGREISRWAETPPGNGRKLFWGISGIVLVAAISAALGLAGSLNGLLPHSQNDIAGNSGGTLVDRIDRPAEVEVAGNNGDPDATPPAKPLNPGKSPASTSLLTVPAIPVTPAAAAEPVPPATVSGKTEAGDETGSLAAAGEQALGSGGNSLDAGTSDAAGDNPAITGSIPAKTEDRLQSPELQRVDPAEQEASTNLATTVDEADAGIARSTELPLSPAQIDGLLARGEALLRNGNVVPARLVFLRVAAAGDQRGARGVGMTYDPEVYARLSVTGLTPDPEQAELWYEKSGENSTFMTLGEKVANKPVQPDANAESRNAACARKYKSFDANTGLYRSYSGVMRPCRLP